MLERSASNRVTEAEMKIDLSWKPCFRLHDFTLNKKTEFLQLSLFRKLQSKKNVRKTSTRTISRATTRRVGGGGGAGSRNGGEPANKEITEDSIW